MKLYADVEDRKKILLEFIKKHPNATHREIREVLHMKVMKVFSGGLEEAFREVGLNSPRTFKRMTKDEKRKIVIDYIRKNPKSGGHVIKRATKINFIPLFKNTKEAFAAAGIEYPREELKKLRDRTGELRKKQIINYLKNNPLENIDVVGRKLNVHPYTLFSSIDEIYSRAGLPYFDKWAKRKTKKQNIVIEFIKNNPIATQREINRVCGTKVQGLFNGGIFTAYKSANIRFPFERLTIHGIAIKNIRDSAVRFEKEIAQKLSGFGTVNRLVRTKRGVADIILERKDKKIVVEVKDFKSHEISMHQIKQVNKYLEDVGSNLGFLVCNKKPKKDTFLIGKNKIVILTDLELSRIPDIVDGSVV